ncbi:phospholipid-transporting ATPase ABCA3-like [Ornithodoros turicata]|uniref:phospholipid-transporting ATPase ABCA3-like n=1 Tax=Ornithodoros turicata TaxID=34597 RepID=UPI00313A208E
MVCVHLRALLWKNLVGGRSSVDHPFVFLPVTFLVAAVLQMEASWMLVDHVISWPIAADKLQSPMGTVPNHTETRVTYGPNTAYARFIALEAFPLLKPACMRNGTSVSCFITTLDTLESVQRLCHPAGYCFYLHSDGNDTSFNYTIVKPADTWTYVIDSPFIYDTQLSSDKQFDIVKLQSRLDYAHFLWLESSTGRTPSTSYNMSSLALLKGFETPGVHGLGERMQDDLLVIFVLTFLIPFVARITAIVKETESDSRVMLQLVGVRESTYWLAHLCTNITITVLSCSWVTGLFVLFPTCCFPKSADVTLVFFALFVFCVHLALHVLLVAIVFSNARKAQVFAILYWFLLAMYPWYVIGRRVFHFVLAPRSLKLVLSATPIMGTYWVLSMITMFSSSGFANWSCITKHIAGTSNITILEIWFAMMITSFVMVLLIWCLTRLLPWVVAAPQPVLFPFMASHKTPGVVDTTGLQSTPPRGTKFERHPDGVAVVVVRGLSMYFGRNKILNEVNVKFYCSEITVLLGHKGAGKTALMNVLAGLLQPTMGTASVCGYDILKSIWKVRRCVGFCPQKDVLYEDLTIREHLHFFAMLKGVNRSQLLERCKSVLHAVRIYEDRYLPKQVSDGIKRKLSVAIAMLTQPKVLLLDEPTTGIDTGSQMDLWNVLLSLRQNCTIVLSTQDAREAEAIGHRIAIICNGEIRGYGTHIFLKNAFGAGYELQIEKRSKFNLYGVLEIVKGTAPDCDVTSATLSEVRVSLGVRDPEGFDKMFATLEQQGQALGIGRIRIETLTMGDVYMRANYDEDGEKNSLAQQEYDLEVERLISLTQQSPMQNRKLRALLTKRLLCLRRNCSALALGTMLPVMLSSLLLYSQSMIGDPGDFSPEQVQFLMGIHLYSYTTVFFENNGGKDDDFAVKYYKPLLQEAERFVEIASVDDHLRRLRESNDVDTYPFAVGGSIIDGRLVGRWNVFYTLSMVVSLNVANTALLRFISGNVDARIVTAVNFGCMPQMAQASTRLADIVPFLSVMLTAICIPLGLAFSACSSVPFLSMERATNNKALQTMYGASSHLYWLSNLIVDCFLFVLSWTAVGVVYTLQYPSLLASAKLAGLLLISAMALENISLAYLLMLTFDNYCKEHVYNNVLLAIFVGGAVPLMCLGYVDKLPIDILLSVLPFYTSPYALAKLLRIDRENNLCLRLLDIKAGSMETPLIRSYCQDRKERNPASLPYCCRQYYANKTREELLFIPQTFSQRGIGLQSVVMIVIGVVLFLYVCKMDSCLEMDYYGRKWRMAEEESRNRAVEAERLKVEKVCTANDFSAYNLVIRRLEKGFKDRSVIRGISLALSPSECIGLIGTNGAGKTTILQTLAGLHAPSGGDAYMDDIILSKHNRKWQCRVGYSVQSGALFDDLTASEMLSLYARLRCVPDVDGLVENLIILLGLTAHEDTIAYHYSPGIKSRLSVAIALVGLRQLLLLDEPSTDADVLSRKMILNIVRAVRKTCGASVIIGSRSMKDYATVCDRIAILHRGRFLCLCTADEFRERHGQGITFSFQVANPMEPLNLALQAAVLIAFPGSELLEFEKVTRTLPWSEVFEKIAGARRRFLFQEVVVRNFTLETIFNNLTETAHSRKPEVPSVTSPAVPVISSSGSQT